MSHLGKFANCLVNEIEPCFPVEMRGHPEWQQDVFLDCQLRHQTAVLRHVAYSEPSAGVGRAHRQVGSLKSKCAAYRLEMTHDRTHQCGLAPTLAAAQTH